MSNKRITDLTELTNPTTDDVFPVVDIATNTTTKVQLGNLPVPSSVTTALATKQDSLVSGTNIKTINSTSVLGSGNIAVQPTLVSGTSIKTVNSNSLLGSGDVAVQETLVSGTNIKTLNNTSLLGSGNIVLTANPSGVSGAIQFSNGSAFASDATNLFWDDTNNRLGVGTNAPGTNFEVYSGAGGYISHNASSGYNGFSGFRCNVAGGTRGYMELNPNTGEFKVGADGSGYFLTLGAAGVERMRVTSTGTIVKGSGSTSATTSLLVQNSAGTAALTVQDNLNTTLGGTLTIPSFQGISSGTNSIAFQTFRTIFNASFNTVAGQYVFLFDHGGGDTNATSGTLGRFAINSRFAPTSGTAVYNTALINPLVNQTGGANGITRGLFIDPTLTAAADFRAIQTTAGKIIFGGLPTSSAGLVSGQLWNDAGTLKIA
jgi:hypothetical protein